MCEEKDKRIQKDLDDLSKRQIKGISIIDSKHQSNLRRNQKDQRNIKEISIEGLNHVENQEAALTEDRKGKHIRTSPIPKDHEDIIKKIQNKHNDNDDEEDGYKPIQKPKFETDLLVEDSPIPSNESAKMAENNNKMKDFLQ